MSERTCLTCRKKGTRADFIRLVAGAVDPVDAAGRRRVLVDPKARMPGRGAWVCPARACIEGLTRKPQILQRALGGPLLVEGLLDMARGLQERDLEWALGMARRSGCLLGGADLLERTIPRGGILALAVSRDAAPRSSGRLIALAPDLPVFHLSMDSATLGALLGCGPRAVLAVRPGKPSEYLLRILRRGLDLG
jgi:hypothetical protein